MKKVLWLTSWYPNAVEPFNGDFIKRQAEAVSLFRPLNILYVGKYKLETPPIRVNTIEDEEKYLNEFILYYPASASGITAFSKLQSLYQYFKIHWTFLKQLRNKNEMPDLVHVHVAMKAGLVALYLKWVFKIPYVLTEHWTGYYPQAKDSLFNKSYLVKYLTRWILRDASCFLPVSESLGNYINKNWETVSFKKIPNVVNTRIFFPEMKQAGKIFRFIHISTLLYQKNPEGIIRSFIQLLSLGFDAELVLVGPVNEVLLAFIQNSGNAGRIFCRGEIPYERVATELRQSDALVMFSHYENMPCVILEALCAGIPVIASRVGGVPEVIREDNGILVNAGNENELLEAMKTMIGNYHLFQPAKISELAVSQFSYETIGREINLVYDSILEKK